MLAAFLGHVPDSRSTERYADGLSLDADMKALEAVRDHISRAATEGALDREIGGDEVTRRRLRAIRDDVRHEAARRELEELKQSLRPPKTLGESTAAGAPLAEALAAPLVDPLTHRAAGGSRREQLMVVAGARGRVISRQWVPLSRRTSAFCSRC